MAVAEDFCKLLGRYRCAACGAPGAPICPPCSRDLVPAEDRRPPSGVDRLIAGFSYGAGARSLVLALKLRGLRAAAAPLAARLAGCVHRKGLSAEALTWVPGRRKDIARRGFDHAEVLARTLARAIGVPALGLLARKVDRPDQTELGAVARRANLEGAFAAERAPGRVALVDDLVTTGATAGACAAALRGAGAVEVELLAACSADLDRNAAP